MEARDVPLVLLVAPAGYGKTTLVADWAASDERRFAWIPADGDTPASTIAGLLELEQLAHPAVLVLDDAHALRDPDVLAALQEAAETMPAESQLVLSGRGEPGLAVGRLRAHRKLLELRTGELTMDVAEAATLLERVGLRLPDEDVDTLVERTEGWPAGLYLAALSVRAEPDVHAAVESFAGDDRLVAEYVRYEQLARLDAAQRAFLVRTSVLDTLTAPVCDAVLAREDSATALAAIAGAGAMLVGLDRCGESYRHHRLLGDLLRAELRRTEPALESELHQRASAWHERHGHDREAIRHALRGGDVDVAVRLLWSEAPGRIARAENDEVRLWLAEFSPDQIAARAPLALVAAASALAAGDGEQLERWTAAAARRLDGRRSGTRAMRDALAVLRAAGGREGVARMGEEAARARRSVREGGLWPAIARLLEGVAAHLSGRAGEARAPLAEGGRGGATAAPGIQALCLAQLVLVAVDDGDWDEAAVLAARARSQLTASGSAHDPTAALVFAASALVRAGRGLPEEARRDLRSSRRLLAELVDFMPWYQIETRLVLARAALLLGDLATAAGLISAAGSRMRNAPDAPTLRSWLAAAQAELRAETLASGDSYALTKAELRVLQLLPTHLSVPAIAGRLYVSPNTVKTHVRAVYRKLDASSRAEAVAHASAAGLLDDAQAA